MISFVTSIKLCKYYEDYGERLIDYIENIKLGCEIADISYEIIICEDVCDKNTIFVKDIINKKSDNYLINHNAKILEVKQTYENPIGYNMIEAYAKNAGLYESVGEYVCITNVDILFNSYFFWYVKERLKKNRFYRFLQFESYNNINTDYLTPLIKAESNVKRAINPFLNVTEKQSKILQNMKSNDAVVMAMGNKSGDIMLMDRENWIKIKGFPENKYWVHSDYVVCRVVYNNKIPMEVVQEPIKIYTFLPKNTQPIVRNERNEGEEAPDVEEWNFSQTYNDQLTCN